MSTAAFRSTFGIYYLLCDPHGLRANHPKFQDTPGGMTFRRLTADDVRMVDSSGNPAPHVAPESFHKKKACPKRLGGTHVSS